MKSLLEPSDVIWILGLIPTYSSRKRGTTFTQHMLGTQL